MCRLRTLECPGFPDAVATSERETERLPPRYVGPRSVADVPSRPSCAEFCDPGPSSAARLRVKEFLQTWGRVFAQAARSFSVAALALAAVQEASAASVCVLDWLRF